MEGTVIWDVVPYSPTEVHKTFRSNYLYPHSRRLGVASRQGITEACLLITLVP
jgi:hypothetical protein